MDFTWAHDVTSVSDLGWDSNLDKLVQLRTLKMNFRFCPKLKDAKPLAEALPKLHELLDVKMDFT